MPVYFLYRFSRYFSTILYQKACEIVAVIIVFKKKEAALPHEMN